MAGLSDYRTALGMRDVMSQLVAREVERNRPRYRYAEVQSVDLANKKALVLYPGELEAVAVPFGEIAVPDGAGQIVRVDGLIGDRFISDIITPFDADLEIAEPWHVIGAAGEPAFQSGWQYFGAGHATPAFYKDKSGLVHVRGMISSGTGQSTMFTLPAGYRPPVREYFSVLSNDGPALLEIYPDGGVLQNQPAVASGWLSMDGVKFLPQSDTWDRQKDMAPAIRMNSWVVSGNMAASVPAVWKRDDGLRVLHRAGMNGGAVGTAMLRVDDDSWVQEQYLYCVFGWTGAPVVSRVDLAYEYGGFMSIGGAQDLRFGGTSWFAGNFDTANWIPATLANGWVPYATAGTSLWRVPSYYKDKYGVVHLHGLAKNGNFNETPMFVLPVGYRPGARLLFPAHTNNNGITRLDILTNGDVRAATVGGGGNNGYLSWDNVTFRAEG